MIPGKLFNEFFHSEKSGGFILLACTAISLIITNSGAGSSYIDFFHSDIGGRPLEFWINDGLMTIFFLLVGLEIERELYVGELSKFRNALMPLAAAVGGMLFPALIHFLFNSGLPTEKGFGIPMATDIAFSLGILSLLGKKVPASLKIFLTALAIIDDLGAILVIAFFYSGNISFTYLLISIALGVFMFILSKCKVYQIWIYLFIGCFLWYFIYKSGIHPTITGVILAFLVPFGKNKGLSSSTSLQQALHIPVAFIILPLFALANTAILFPGNWSAGFWTANSLGIILGLILGKPLGIFFMVWAGVKTNIFNLPADIKWKHISGVGLLAGIGFTMSIFISLLAYDSNELVTESKIAIITASLISGILGLVWLRAGYSSGISKRRRRVEK